MFNRHDYLKSFTYILQRAQKLMDMHDQHAADNADNIGLTLPPIEESLPMVQQKIMPKTSNQVTEICHAGQICRYYFIKNLYYYFSLTLTFNTRSRSFVMVIIGVVRIPRYTTPMTDHHHE